MERSHRGIKPRAHRQASQARYPPQTRHSLSGSCRFPARDVLKTVAGVEQRVQPLARMFFARSFFCVVAGWMSIEAQPAQLG